jgi:hypothetical protein
MRTSQILQVFALVVIFSLFAQGPRAVAQMVGKSSPPYRVQSAKLVASDGAAYDCLGWSSAVSGDIVVVGEITGLNGCSRGAVYVFGVSGSTWNQLAELTASDGAAGEEFGATLAINGDTIVVGHTAQKLAATFTQARFTYL